MIDEKKIKEAAIAFDNKAEWTEDADAQAIVQYSFKNGVNWALQEFKKSLWHDVSEEPKEGSSFVYIDGKGEVWSLEDYYADNFDDSFHRGWLAAIDNFGVTKWCYIDDLLPKEGGEQ